MCVLFCSYTSDSLAVLGSEFRSQSERVYITNVSCNGSEVSLDSCHYDTLSEQGCRQTGAAVECQCKSRAGTGCSDGYVVLLPFPRLTQLVTLPLLLCV